MERWERSATVGRKVDELVEESLQRRRTVPETLGVVLPVLAEATGASGALLRTYGDDLSLAAHVWPAGFELPREAEVLERTAPGARGRTTLVDARGMLVAQPLDVAGEWFGQAALLLPADADADAAQEILDAVCEELDDYLFGVRAARMKHQLVMRLGEALRHRVLGEGLRRAVAVLAEAVPFSRLLLACLPEEDADAELPHVQVFEGSRPAYDTMGGELTPPADAAAIRSEAAAWLSGLASPLLARFGFARGHEELLISGITQAVVVGKLVAGSTSGSFNTYDRELLAAFASFISQRVVDFGKEWRALAESFRSEDVAHLLQVGDYQARWLSPREAEVAILYADISGFTRLSEEVLQQPAAVAELVEAWSRDAVRLVWEHAGVFDKMVGDCVIALFGPPFYETTPGERLLRALRCARAIREMTRRLPQRLGLARLQGCGLGVATGVNLCPLFVGTFGPNRNFTGFSRGMNNTARLQGCAARDEILVMSHAAARLTAGDGGLRFGPEREARVKNVAEPLRFRALLD
jgi:adenylate cyclase